jgi:hypothetical protein
MNDAFRQFEATGGDNAKPVTADTPSDDQRAPAVVNLRAILAVAIQVFSVGCLTIQIY